MASKRRAYSSFSNSRASSNVEDRRPRYGKKSTADLESDKALHEFKREKVKTMIDIHNGPFAGPTIQRELRRMMDQNTSPNHRVSTRRLKIKREGIR